MADDGITAAEIARQIAALKPRAQGSRGVMGYMAKPQSDKRADVNKTFLASTIRGVDLYNRRQEEEKYWTLRRTKHKLGEAKGRQRSSLRSRSHRLDEKKRHRSSERSRSRNCSRQFRRSQSGNWRSSSRSRSRQSSFRSKSRRSSFRSSRSRSDKLNEHDERNYWARKKADKTRKLWKNLHSDGTVSVENAPDFSDELDDDDIKPIN